MRVIPLDVDISCMIITYTFLFSGDFMKTKLVERKNQRNSTE